MAGCIAARRLMAKARSREATITKVAKVEVVADVENGQEIRVSGSNQNGLMIGRSESEDRGQ